MTVRTISEDRVRKDLIKSLVKPPDGKGYTHVSAGWREVAETGHQFHLWTIVFRKFRTRTIKSVNSCGHKKD